MRTSLWIKVPTLGLAAAAAWWFDGALGWALAAGILLAGITLLMGIVFHPNSNVWAKTLWQAPSATDAVALTFDDGPDLEFTPKVLRILEERGVPAAFFVVGERVRRHPEVVSQLHAAGHLVCNHTDTHDMKFHFWLWGPYRRDLRACNAEIEAAIGRQPTLFRSPQGAKNPALGDVLTELHMTAIGWQVRGLDSLGGDARAIEERVVRGARPGGVIVLHDGTGLGGLEDRSATIAALPRIIDRLREHGMRFVRLDDLLDVEAYCPAAS